MKKVTTTLLRLALTLVVVTGATVCATAATKDLTAAQIMQRVTDKLTGAPSLDIVVEGQNGPQTYRAELKMAQQKFVYNIGPLKVFYDGRTQWTVDSDSKEVSITEPTADEVVETNPLAFVRNYNKNYKVSLLDRSEGTYTLKMTAIGKKSYVRSAQVVVSGTTWLPTHVTALLSTGQTLTLRIVKAQAGAALKPETFVFSPTTAPGYEIVDLR